MIYYAQDLHALLTHLTLVGQEEDGELQFMGTTQQWDKTIYYEN
jgi:hypothetical protein